VFSQQRNTGRRGHSLERVHCRGDEFKTTASRPQKTIVSPRGSRKTKPYFGGRPNINTKKNTATHNEAPRKKRVNKEKQGRRDGPLGSSKSKPEEVRPRTHTRTCLHTPAQWKKGDLGTYSRVVFRGWKHLSLPRSRDRNLLKTEKGLETRGLQTIVPIPFLAM